MHNKNEAELVNVIMRLEQRGGRFFGWWPGLSLSLGLALLIFLLAMSWRFRCSIFCPYRWWPGLAGEVLGLRSQWSARSAGLARMF
jgi:hypothetical protein